MHPETPFRIAFVVLSSLMVLVRLRAHRAARIHEPGVKNPDEGLAVRVMRWAVLPLWVGITIAWLIRPESVGLFFVHYPSGLRWAGVGLFGLGLGLLVWVHETLGRFFSPFLRIRADHELVTEGPYRWVRHPMYTSFLLLMGGYTLITANLLFTVALGVMFGVIILYRTPREETMLRERFGDAWDAYRARTGALLPRLAR